MTARISPNVDGISTKMKYVLALPFFDRSSRSGRAMKNSVMKELGRSCRYEVDSQIRDILGGDSFTSLSMIIDLLSIFVLHDPSVCHCARGLPELVEH
jgi:hypothetical protein